MTLDQYVFFRSVGTNLVMADPDRGETDMEHDGETPQRTSDDLPGCILDVVYMLGI